MGNLQLAGIIIIEVVFPTKIGSVVFHWPVLLSLVSWVFTINL